MIKILFFSENILYKLICDLIKIRFRCTRKKLKNEEIQRDVKDNYECDDRLRKIFSDLREGPPENQVLKCVLGRRKNFDF